MIFQSSLRFRILAVQLELTSSVTRTYLWKCLFLFSTLSTTKLCIGQNLIPNPGFEILQSCPPGIGYLGCALPWFSARESPDLFHECAEGTTADVPQNTSFGFQEPHSGLGFAGLFAYESLGYRECFGIQLNEPIEEGDYVFFSFYVNRSDGGLSNLLDCACNNLGIRFTNEPYSSDNPIPIDNFSNWHTEDILDDTLNWIHISGDFVSNSLFEYVYFGNFYENESTDTIDFTIGDCAVYYYIDDICISKNSDCLTDEIVNNNHREKLFEVFPTIFNNQIVVNPPAQTSRFCLDIFNSFGKHISQHNFMGLTTLDTSQFSSGIYFFRITSNHWGIPQADFKLIKP